MLSNRSLTRILAILSLEFISFDRFYAQSESCYDVDNKTVCYFQPNVTSTYMTWDDAWKVCKEHHSTLPVIENRRIEETLKSYVESKASFTNEMWLAGREVRTNVWQWLNGKPFGRPSIKGKGRYDTNVAITRKLEYLANWAIHSKYYICHCTDCILCQKKEALRFGNGCTFVNNDEPSNLFDARNRCLDNGGDLATFEEDEDLEVLQQNRFLLHEHNSYWIGLRLNWWIWNETDSGEEIKYTNWYRYRNPMNQECLSIHLENYKWSQSNCTATKPFICQTVKTSGTDEPETSTFPHRENAYSTALVALTIGVIVVIAVVIIVSLIIVLKIRNSSASGTGDRNVPAQSSYETLQHRLHEQDALESNQNYTELQLTQPKNRSDGTKTTRSVAL